GRVTLTGVGIAAGAACALSAAGSIASAPKIAAARTSATKTGVHAFAFMSPPSGTGRAAARATLHHVDRLRVRAVPNRTGLENAVHRTERVLQHHHAVDAVRVLDEAQIGRLTIAHIAPVAEEHALA